MMSRPLVDNGRIDSARFGLDDDGTAEAREGSKSPDTKLLNNILQIEDAETRTTLERIESPMPATWFTLYKAHLSKMHPY